MSNDRELLELAAKAAGITLAWSSMEDQSPRNTNGWDAWNPLKDDGDAFRLVIRLKELGLWTDATKVEPREIEGFWDGDACAATRSSIVRAAAEIGRTK